jgi:hypothetical protein
MPNFPDLHHFEQIRQRLWCGREFGQAAVMVGAGFSWNAEKIAPSTPDFPLWSDLASDIYDELYPQTQGLALTDEQRKANDKAKERALANPLALASEYEVTFGSPALQDLLIRSIPDNQYNPGRLHNLLMSLPWELPSLQELEMTIESSPLIRFEERPEYRRLAFRLAHFLYYF